MVLAGAGHAADVHEAGASIGQHDVVLDGTPGVAVSRFSKVEQYWQRVATSQASSSEEVLAANDAVQACLRACGAVARSAADAASKSMAAMVLLKHVPVGTETASVVDAEALKQLVGASSRFLPLRYLAGIPSESSSDLPKVRYPICFVCALELASWLTAWFLMITP